MKIGMMMAAGLAAAMVSGAQASTVTASYTGDYGAQVHTNLGNIQTVKFSWTRVDSPGPGVDSTIAHNFNTYCVEISQHVSSGHDYTYNVVSGAAHGFSPAQEALLGRLWWSYFAGIDSATESAAFQIAVWEIALDNGLNLTGGGLAFTGPAATLTLADSYLAGITGANYAGGAEIISVLENDGAQDQVTVIPSPGAFALAGLGLLTVGRRRR